MCQALLLAATRAVLLRAYRLTTVDVVPMCCCFWHLPCHHMHIPPAQPARHQHQQHHVPQVVLGFPYTMAIDMWSLGCMAAELFLGLPLFPGASEHDLLTRIIDALGTPPPFILEQAKHCNKFFKVCVGFDHVRCMCIAVLTLRVSGCFVLCTS